MAAMVPTKAILKSVGRIRASEAAVHADRLPDTSPACAQWRLPAGSALRSWLLGFVMAATALPVLALDQQQVMAGASVLYRERIDALRQAHVLDDDAAFHARVQRIAGPLLAQAARDYPVSADWPWEIHTTTDPEEHAYAMAGGKLLVSSAYVAQQGLSDAELAMVLAHEIAHAVLLHNLLEYEAAMQLDPGWAARPFAELEYAVDHDGALMAKLAPLGVAQELEADRAGLTLAARAGWPPHALAGYFRKLVQASSAPNAAGFAHPSPAVRWRAARELAQALSD